MAKRRHVRSVHRRRGITIAAAAVAMAMSIQGLPAVGSNTIPQAVAAPWPGDDAWNEATMVQADNLAGGKTIRGVGDLNADRGSVWGFAQFADRNGMEGDDAWAPWRDTHLPAGIPVYMRYQKTDGTMSRIHKAVTHTVPWSNMTVYSFKFQDGQPRLRPSGNVNDFNSSADVQIMIGQNNSVMNPTVGEPMSVVRVTPGGAYHSGVAADADLMRLTIDSSHGDNDRTWRSTMLKFYQVSPAATKLKGQLTDTADKAIKRTYSGMVWNDTMRATGGENNWNNNYNNSVDRGVKRDAVDTPAIGHTVYQAVPNEAAYQALAAIRNATNNGDNNFRNNPALVRDRQAQIAEYVRNNPENFTVYKAEVSDTGHYTLNSSFDNAKHADFIYMWVEDANGIKTNMSAWGGPEFRSPMGDDRLTESGHSFQAREASYYNGHIPYHNHLNGSTESQAAKRDGAGNWTNVHFALATNADGSSHSVTPATPDPGKNAEDFDPGYDPVEVAPGDTVVTKPPADSDGKPLPPDTEFEIGDNDFPGEVTIDPATGKVTITPGNDATPGDYTIPVVVTYPDGSEDTIDVPVTVTEPTDPQPDPGSDADDNDPSYPDVEAPKGEDTIIEPPKNSDGSDLPPDTTFEEGPGGDFPGDVTVDPGTGEIVVRPGDDAEPGDYTIPVVVTYPDDTTDEVDVTVTIPEDGSDPIVDVPDSSEFEPAYGDYSGPPGVATPITQTGDRIPEGTIVTLPTAPAGWTFGEPDAQGNFTVTPPANVAPGTKITMPVRFTYPDGTSEFKNATFTVTNDAHENDPRYGDREIAPRGEGTIVPAPQNQDGSPLPTGTDFAQHPDLDVTGPGGVDLPGGFPGTIVVDPTTGAITVTPNDDAPTGNYNIPVEVTYPDGSTDTIWAGVYVPEDETDTPVSDLAADNDPDYGEYFGRIGEPIEVSQTGEQTLPANTRIILPTAPAGFTFGEPDANGNFTVTADDSIAPGTAITLPVVFIYSDGTVDRATAKVTVTDDAYDNDPTYGDRVTTPQGEDTVIAPPKNSDGSDLPPGTTFEPGIDPEEFPGTFEVNPETGAVTVNPDDNVVPGDYDIPVVVTYPDGSTETIPVKIHIPEPEGGTPTDPTDPTDPSGPSDAEENDPSYSDTTGKAGVPTLIDQDGDRELPEGTTFRLPPPPAGWSFGPVDANGDFTITPPANATPGTRVNIPVVVTYPDGSVDRTNAVFVVVGNDADNNDPTYPDVEAPKGEDTTIDAPTNPDGSPLPEDSTFEEGEGGDFPGTVEVDPGTGEIVVRPGDDAEPGDYTIPVVVTYPDGTTDEVDVTVTIPEDSDGPGDGGDGGDGDDTDAENNNPGYQNQTGPAGEPVAFDQTGDTDLPDGTRFIFPTVPNGWNIEGDAATGDFTITAPEGTPDGSKSTIPIRVVYPDGSMDTLYPVFTVTNDGGDGGDGGDSDKDNNDPSYPDQPIVTPKEKDTVIEPPTNSDGSPLPEDTTFEPGPGVDEFPGTIEIDPGTGEIVVNPDKDARPGDYTIPVIVTYPDGSQESIEVTIRVPADPGNVIVEPGDKVIITPGDGGPTPDDIIIKDPDGKVIDPGQLEIIIKEEDGKIVITFPDTLKPGDYTVEFAEGKEPIEVIIIRGETDPTDQSDGEGASSVEGMSSNPRCLAGLLGIGIPVLLLIPLGLATQVSIPGLEQFQGQARTAIRDVNTMIQRNLGVFNNQLAGIAGGVNVPTRELATLGGGLALTAIGLLIADQIAKNCVDGYDGLSSTIGGEANGSSAGGNADGGSSLTGEATTRR